MSRTSESQVSVVRKVRPVGQRRCSRRRPLNAMVEVISPATGHGVTINVSDGGLRVAVDCPLRPDEICLLRIDDFSGAPRLERARVAWSRELHDGWIAGLQLIGLH
jgi:hypothetical protein